MRTSLAHDRANAGTGSRSLRCLHDRITTVPGVTAPDLHAAADVIDLARRVVGKAVRHLAANGGPDRHQTLAYDLAHAAAQVETASSMLDYGAKGELE